jgi:drug/metabolite transporter (DMT)-like permease
VTTTSIEKRSVSVSAAPPAAPAPLTLAYVGLALTIGCWGLLPVFQKQLLEVMDPVELTFVRFFLSGVLLLAVVLAQNPRGLIDTLRRSPRGIVVSSICGPLMAMVAFNFGLQTVAVGLASLIVALEPMLAYLLAVAVGQERWSGVRALYILVALVGVALVVVADRGVGGGFWLGLLAVCAMPLVWAINTVISKDLVARESPLVLVTANFLISSVCLLPFVGGALLPKLQAMPAPQWAALAFCVLPGSVLAYSIWYGSLRVLSPSTLSLSLYACPVIGLLGGVVAFGEQLTVLKYVGVALVLYGLYRVNATNKEKNDV